jgi:uncharacterized membrane protein YoaK (UPF0700 family)
MTGGMLDSYSFLNRGEVFSTAQTGNIALMGLHLAQRNWGDALRYLLPVLSFIIGVLVAEVLHQWMGPGIGRLHWRQPILLLECLVLVLVSFIPSGRLDLLATIMISFTSALQIESFRTFHGCSCSTTMCTGDLRSATEHLFRHLTIPGSQSGAKSALYYGLVFFFMSGAVVIGLLSPLFHCRTVLIACLPLFLAFLLLFQAPPSASSS